MNTQYICINKKEPTNVKSFTVIDSDSNLASVYIGKEQIKWGTWDKQKFLTFFEYIHAIYLGSIELVVFIV